MKLIRPFLKIAALTSAVVLVAAFVSYRAGAFDWLAPRGTPAPEIVLDPSTFSVSQTNMMSSSKSGTVFVEPVAPAQGQQAAQPAPTLMGGSKTLSVGPLVQPPPANTQGPPPTAQAQQPTAPTAPRQQSVTAP
jgi:hypothetical protein